MLARLTDRVKLAIRRGRLTGTDDAAAVQAVQVVITKGEVREAVRHLQAYGLTAHAHPGAEVLVVAVGAHQDHPVAAVVEDGRHRPTELAEGEVCLYSSHGQTIHLKADGSVAIDAPGAITVTAGGAVTVDAASIALQGGGAKVARVGDRVNVGSGSSAGLWPIVEGSDTVECG